MAKVYALPAEVPKLEVDYRKPFDERQKMEVEWAERLRAWCKKHGSGAMRGEIISTGVADGHAQYMIYKHSPFSIIHMPLGDAYRAGAIWERGLRLSDAKAFIEGDRKLKELFGREKK